MLDELDERYELDELDELYELDELCPPILIFIVAIKSDVCTYF